MLFWALVAVTGGLAGLWIAAPFLSKGSMQPNDDEAAVSIYRDQIDEVRKDRATGQIAEDEAQQAEREIQSRALKAARRLDSGFLMSKRSVPVAAGVAIAVAALGIGSYASLGAAGTEDQPLAERRTEILQQRADAGDPNARIALMIERVEQDPENFDDWWILATSYSTVGNHTAAAEAYRRAVELGGDRPGVLSAYAESMVLANGNKVPQAARLIFQQILTDQPDPRARYYLALAKAQAQDFEGALYAWSQLAQDSKPDAPWMPLVRRDMINMAKFLKVDLVTYLPDATPGEIAASGGEIDRDAAATRIATLEAALAAEPMNYDGWIELADLRLQTGDMQGAVDAVSVARDHFRAAPFVLQKIDEAARALGLDIVETGTRGPTDADIAAASNLTEAERSDMIEGMVAGLAARLAEDPSDADGWVMLVRSYVTMGRPDKARSSYDAARAQFVGDNAVLARLEQDAGALLTP